MSSYYKKRGVSGDIVSNSENIFFDIYVHCIKISVLEDALW